MRMELKGNLIVISGPSAAGKGTICKALLNGNKSLAYSVSATTRAPREGEVNGVNYWFTSEDEFKSMIANEQLLEWAEVYGNYYGTPLARVESMLKEGRDVILEIDTQGAMLVKKKFPEGVFVYILPPSLNELRNRIHKRGTDSKESMARRLAAAAEELRHARHYDYVVVNNIVEEAARNIAAIIAAEKCSVRRSAELIRQIAENKGE